jgi:hypothetical protein
MACVLSVEDEPVIGEIRRNGWKQPNMRWPVRS